jgi:hypothetical protein
MTRHTSLRPFAGVNVQFVAPTERNSNPRWTVRIRDFPTKVYDQSLAPDEMQHDEMPQFFAEKRLKELKLDWKLSGLTYFPTMGYVFTTN